MNLCTLFAIVAAHIPSLAFAGYDPLREAPAGTSVELKFTDSKRSRELPLLVYLPADAKPAPVVLFSHGLGGSRSGSAFLGKHWAAHGYVAVFLQHPGSDEGVWQDVPAAARMVKLKAAASAENFAHRTKDVVAVLDQLSLWQKESGHALAGRLDMEHVGMSGHSFGAVTTQAVGGQSSPLVGARFADTRIDAAVPMSHSPPRRGDVAAAFGAVKIPWMLMTGTKDDSIVADFKPADRAKVFDTLPPGGKYELILNNAEHSAFTERALPGDKEPRNPNHHRVILALSTAFFDAHLRNDALAKAWLEGDGPRSVMEKDDTLRKK
jgi:predicted dienelactone hydrolase